MFDDVFLFRDQSLERDPISVQEEIDGVPGRRRQVTGVASCVPLPTMKCLSCLTNIPSALQPGKPDCVIKSFENIWGVGGSFFVKRAAICRFFDYEDNFFFFCHCLCSLVIVGWFAVTGDFPAGIQQKSQTLPFIYF